MSELRDRLQQVAIRTDEDRKRDVKTILICLPWVEEYLSENEFNTDTCEELPDGSFQFVREDYSSFSDNKQHIVKISKENNGYTVKTERFGRYTLQTYDSEGIETERKLERNGRAYTYKRDPEYIEKVDITISEEGVVSSQAYADLSKDDADIATLDGAADEIGNAWLGFCMMRAFPWGGRGRL